MLWFTDECGVEVEIGVPLEAEVVSEEEGNENTGNDNVAETQHGKISGVQTILEEILEIQDCCALIIVVRIILPIWHFILKICMIINNTCWYFVHDQYYNRWCSDSQCYKGICGYDSDPGNRNIAA